jgi:2-polyprenyl-3-methyl-5-hydroxy-6-metoxy-1,4-benzoquinol methylase
MEYLKILKNLKNSLKKKDYSFYFNTPIKISRNEWTCNERIVEKPFALNLLPEKITNKKILDFGCTKSDMSIILSSLGFDVTGVDLRQYKFNHPNFTFYKGNIMNLQSTFDYIIAISTVEHVGLPTYGEQNKENNLTTILEKLESLLKINGKLIITVPIGKKYEDNFLRVFTPEEINQWYTEMELIQKKYFYRKKNRFWFPCNGEFAGSLISQQKGVTGVNCVGCFCWQKVKY